MRPKAAMRNALLVTEQALDERQPKHSTRPRPASNRTTAGHSDVVFAPRLVRAARVVSLLSFLGRARIAGRLRLLRRARVIRYARVLR